VSPGTNVRAFRWGRWAGTHPAPEGLEIVGFEHQCSHLTAVRELEHEAGELICSGCRYEITDPERECKPLFGHPE